jgi:hypothetical protein
MAHCEYYANFTLIEVDSKAADVRDVDNNVPVCHGVSG